MRHLSLAALLLLAPPAAAQAPQPKPLTAEAMWGLVRVGDPTITPDGKTAIVPMTRFDLDKNRGFTDLYAIPTAGGPAKQLTSNPANEGEATVSPDGKWLAFITRRDDDKAGQLWVLPLDGGEARRVTSVPTGVFAPQWFPDSKRVAVLSRVWPELKSWDEQAKRLKERDDSKTTAKVWTQAPVTYWDRWTDDREVHLFAVALDGGAPTPITQGSGQPLWSTEPSASSYSIAPDGQEIAYEGNSDRTGIRPNGDVFLIPASGGKAQNLTPSNPASDGDPLFSPDGRHLAYTSGTVVGFYADRRMLMLRERKSGKVSNLTQTWDRTAGGLIWAPDSRALFGAIDDAATRRIYRFGLTPGNPTPVTKANDFSGLAMAGGTLVALRQSFSFPTELVRVDPRAGAVTKLSTVNDAALAATAMGKVESVTYKGAEGRDIQMWVVYPPGFDPAKKYPLFLLLHGGPHNGITDAWTWRWNAHVFAGWGYVVAWHNFHGSSGFGQAFTDSINPDWATKPYADTIAAAQWFQAQPWIDSKRMVAGGGSYGGYLASLLLGREHPFQTLIAHAAVYNLYTQEASDGGANKARFWEYWENPQAYQAISPHMAAANFKTPTLVIHGQLDYRVPVNHGIELFNTLQNRGVPSKFVYYSDENHWILRAQNSLHWYRTVQDWVQTYAKPGAQ
jgi:dipeptidyl aminopeptidase/acylaminoacyl peptidase